MKKFVLKFTFMLSISACHFTANARIPFAEFKDVDAAIKHKAYSPWQGYVALEHYLDNARFRFGNWDMGYEKANVDGQEVVRRTYQNDAGKSPFTALMKAFFTSVGSQLDTFAQHHTAMHNHIHAGNGDTGPRIIANLMNYCFFARKCIEEESLKGITANTRLDSITQLFGQIKKGQVYKESEVLPSKENIEATIKIISNTHNYQKNLNQLSKNSIENVRYCLKKYQDNMQLHEMQDAEIYMENCIQVTELLYKNNNTSTALKTLSSLSKFLKPKKSFDKAKQYAIAFVNDMMQTEYETAKKEGEISSLVSKDDINEIMTRIKDLSLYTNHPNKVGLNLPSYAENVCQGLLKYRATLKSDKHGETAIFMKWIQDKENIFNDIDELSQTLKEKQRYTPESAKALTHLKEVVGLGKSPLEALEAYKPYISRKTDEDQRYPSFVLDILKNINFFITGTIKDAKKEVMPNPHADEYDTYDLERLILGYLCFDFDKKEHLKQYVAHLDDEIKDPKIKINDDQFNLFDLTNLKKIQADNMDDIMMTLFPTRLGSEQPSPYNGNGKLPSNRSANAYKRKEHVPSGNFADCYDITLLHFWNIALYEPKTKQFAVESLENALKEHFGNHWQPNDAFREFQKFFDNQDPKKPCKDDIDFRTRWSGKVITDLNENDLKQESLDKALEPQYLDRINYKSPEKKDLGGGIYPDTNYYEVKSDYQKMAQFVRVIEKLLGVKLERLGWDKGQKTAEQNFVTLSENPTFKDRDDWLKRKLDPLMNFMNKYVVNDEKYEISFTEVNSEKSYISFKKGYAAAFELRVNSGHPYVEYDDSAAKETNILEEEIFQRNRNEALTDLFNQKTSQIFYMCAIADKKLQSQFENHTFAKAWKFFGIRNCYNALIYNHGYRIFQDSVIPLALNEINEITLYTKSTEFKVKNNSKDPKNHLHITREENEHELDTLIPWYGDFEIENIQFDKVKSISLAEFGKVKKVLRVKSNTLQNIIGIAQCKDLETLILKTPSLQSLPSNLSNLKHLEIEAELDKHYKCLYTNLEKLKLTIIGRYSKTLSCEWLRNLRDLEVNSDSLEEITDLAKCENLEILSLMSQGINSRLTKLSCDSFSNLKHLYLKIHNSRFNDVNLNHCQQLETLHAEFSLGRENKTEFSKLQNLKDLDITNVRLEDIEDLSACTNIVSIKIKGITLNEDSESEDSENDYRSQKDEQSIKARAISLNGLKFLQNISLVNYGYDLFSITIKNCDALTDLTLDLPMSTVHINDCKMLAKINELRSDNITSMDISGCCVLREADIGFYNKGTLQDLVKNSALKYLNLTGTAFAQDADFMQKLREAAKKKLVEILSEEQTEEAVLQLAE